MFNVIDQYNSFVENNFIKKNKDQIEFLKQADTYRYCTVLAGI